MRSNKSALINACCIRDFGLLRRFLPIVLPADDHIKGSPHGDLRLLPKVARYLDIEVLRRANVGVTEEPRLRASPR